MRMFGFTNMSEAVLIHRLINITLAYVGPTAVLVSLLPYLVMADCLSKRNNNNSKEFIPRNGLKV